MCADVRGALGAIALAFGALLPRAAFAGPVVVLSWEQMPGATGYEVEIAVDADFTETVVKAEVELPRYEWSALPERTFHWRVRALHSFGRHGQWSVVKTIPRAVWPVTLEQPAPEEQTVCAEGSSLVLGFRTSPALAEYRVEIAEDAAFSAPVFDVRTSVGLVEWTPTRSGPFYWRVSATDVAGRPVAPSVVWRFAVQRPRPAVSIPVRTTVVASSGSIALASIVDLAVEPEPPASPRVAGRTAAAQAAPWTMSAGAGWRDNFARASGTTPVIGASHELDVPPGIGRSLSGGVTFTSFRVATSMPGGTRARADVAEAALFLEVERKSGNRRAAIHAGPVLQVVRARVGSVDELGATGAASIGGSVAGPLGRASWFAGMEVRAGRWEGRYAGVSTGGVLLSAGVRFGR